LTRDDYIALFKQLNEQGKAIVAWDVSELCTLIVTVQYACNQAVGHPSATLTLAKRMAKEIQKMVAERNPYLAKILDLGWENFPDIFDPEKPGNGQD